MSEIGEREFFVYLHVSVAGVFEKLDKIKKEKL